MNRHQWATFRELEEPTTAVEHAGLSQDEYADHELWWQAQENPYRILERALEEERTARRAVRDELRTKYRDLALQSTGPERASYRERFMQADTEVPPLAYPLPLTPKDLSAAKTMGVRRWARVFLYMYVVKEHAHTEAHSERETYVDKHP